MADMVYSALRRKLAVAEAAGDFKWVDRIRGAMKPLEAEVPQVPAEVPEIDEPSEARPPWDED
jgi:hypothetical protein